MYWCIYTDLDTAVWMHHLDANKTAGEEAGRQLHKNVAILNKSWQQHPTKHQLYGHLPPITKTIQIRWTRHAGHCWRSRDELISDVFQWTPTYGRAKAGRPARTYGIFFYDKLNSYILTIFLLSVSKFPVLFFLFCKKLHIIIIIIIISEMLK